VDKKAATGASRAKQLPTFIRGRRRSALLRLTWACVDYDEFIRTATRATFEEDFLGEMLVFLSVKHTVATEAADDVATEPEIMAVTGHKSSLSVQAHQEDHEISTYQSWNPKN